MGKFTITEDDEPIVPKPVVSPEQKAARKAEHERRITERVRGVVPLFMLRCDRSPVMLTCFRHLRTINRNLQVTCYLRTLKSMASTLMEDVH
jgi:hypothetical protein